MRFGHVEFEKTIDGFDMGAFEDAVEASAPAAAEPAEPEAEEAPAETDERSRDEAGRFASETEEPEPEAPEEEEPETAAAVAPDEIDSNYLASIGSSAEEFAAMDERAQALVRGGERQYRELRRSADARSQELAEARRQREDPDDDFADREVDRPYVDPSAVAGKVAALVTQGKFQEAAIVAYSNSGGAESDLYRSTLTAWGDENPAEMTAFQIGVARLEDRREREQEMAPVIAERVKSAQTSAWAELERARPDAREEIAKAFEAGVPRPIAAAVNEELNSGDPARVREALGALHDWATGRRASENAAASPAARAQQAAADAALKEGAVVATSEHTKPAAPKKVLSEDDRIQGDLADFMKLQDTRADVSAGLTKG